jgi:hypothetical protein
MIHEALTFIQNQLNEYFRNRFGLSEDVVIISNIVNQDGTSAIKDENKVILSLVGMEEERMISHGQKQMNSGGRGYSGTNPPVIMNLYILFSTSFSGQMVKESLKFISVIIGFFQSNNVFTSKEYSDLKNEKLIFEIFNLNFLEQNNLWASMGAKYVPSILYRVRMVVIEEGLIQFEIPEIGKVDDDRKQPGEGLPLNHPPINPLGDVLKDATDSVRKLAEQDEGNQKTTAQPESPQSNLLNEDQFDDFVKDK